MSVLNKILVLAAVASCTPPPIVTSARIAAIASVSVRDYGAVGDGATDDRASIQAALDAGAGAVVVVPPGRYVVGQAGSSFWGLSIPADTMLRGEPGAVLAQAPGTAGAVRLLQVSAAGVTIQALELDGQRSKQADTDAHRAGLFASCSAPTVCSGLVVRDVIAHDFTGDGVYLYIGADGATIDHVTAVGNGRNGLTLGGGTRGTLIAGSTFAGNRAQQLDSEPVTPNTVDDVTISDSTIGRGTTGDYALTISGSSAVTMSKKWRVRNVVIDGAIFVVWARDVRLERIAGTNSDPHASAIYRTSEDVTVVDCDLTATAAPAVLAVLGTAGGPPVNIQIARNVLTMAGHAGVGLDLEGVDSVRVVDNTLTGPAVANCCTPGILLRATLAAQPVRSAVIRRNRIANWGTAGLEVWGNGAAQILMLDIVDNECVDTGAGTMPACMALDFDHTHAAQSVQQSGNLALGAVTQLVRDPPAGVWSAWGSGDRWGIWP